ncbi:TLC domain-containing protein 4-B-like [Apostichopus japonicus]|uniref:TLC domain-containing protein 4-B-like n=1 Tax=Stichopus japonicus TaxID=307972 RepID=UPI003AB18B0E
MEGNITYDIDELYQINYAYPAVALISWGFFTFLFLKASPSWSKKLFPAYDSLSDNLKQDWNSRVTSLVHCAIVSPIAIYVVLADEEVNRDPVWGYSVISRIVMAITEGFMLADFLVIIKYFPLKDAIIFSFHHLATLYPYTYNVLYGPMPYFGCFKLTTEGSTPFVNLRWFLSTLELTDGDLYFYNGILMTFSFFVLRILTIIPYWISVYRTFSTHPMPGITPHMRNSLIFGSIALDLLNIYWFRKMLLGAKKVMDKRNLANEKEAKTIKDKEL